MREDIPAPYRYRGIFYCQDEETGRIVHEVFSRHQIPLTVIEGMAVAREGRGINLTTLQALEVQPPGVRRRGITLIKDVEKGGRLSSTGIRFLGRWAKRGVVTLDRKQFKRFLRGETLKELEGRGERVIVRYGEMAIGGGILSRRGLIPMLPKAAKSVTHLPPEDERASNP